MATKGIMRNEITRRLVDKFHPEEVILFGCSCCCAPRDDSDVDLASAWGRRDSSCAAAGVADEVDYARRASPPYLPFRPRRPQ